MGEVISARAAVDSVEDHVRQSLMNAKARGDEVAEAAEGRLGSAVEAIDAANAELARVEQIKAFRILPKALDPEEEGEPVTPTRKVKRNLMQERFKSLIDAMYDDREERRLAEEVGGALRG